MSDTANTGSPRLTRARRSVPVNLGRFEPIDSRQALVLEIGNKFTKIGCAGEYLPQAIIRTEVPSFFGEITPVFDKNRDEAEQYRYIVKFFKEIFFRHLLITPKDRRFVIVESVLNPTTQRNLIAKALFETFEVSSVLFAPSHLLATFPFGTKNAFVVDVGYKETLVLPILEGVTVLNRWEVSCIGASRLEQRALELLQKHGKIITSEGSFRDITEEDVGTFKKNKTIEDIIVRCCFVTSIDRARNLKSQELNAAGDAFQGPVEVRLSHGDEILIVPGYVREFAAEVFFEYDTDEKSLPQLILDCIYLCPVDCRRKLLESLILTGGPTRMKGFYSRLKDELKYMVKSPEYCYFNKLGHIDSVKFFLYPNTPLEMIASWLGGSMFGALEVLQYRSTSRDEWLAHRTLPDWTAIIAQGG